MKYFVFSIKCIIIFAFFGILNTIYHIPNAVYADDPCSPISNGPLLYEIDRVPTQATLFFTPAGNDQIQTYDIIYGFKAEDERYSVTFNQGVSTGAISYKINDLLPGIQYFYKVRGNTPCTSSPWSSWEGDKAVATGSSTLTPGIPVTGSETTIAAMISFAALIGGIGIFAFAKRKN